MMTSGLRAWFLRFLDWLLSEHLRRGSASELLRSRVLAGAACFLFLFTLLTLVMFPPSMISIAIALVSACYVITLVLLHHATSHVLPAMVLCMSLVLACAICSLAVLEDVPIIGTHAGFSLLPALAVYLLGIRRGFLITLFFCFSPGLLIPLYSTHFKGGAYGVPEELFWPLYGAAIIAFLGTWGLGSLHSTATSEAQATLERTLTDLRESEGRLLSIFESTDDVVALLDTEGRLLIANSAAKQAYLQLFGQEPVIGQPYIPESAPELRALWMPRLAKAIAGERQRYEELYKQGDTLFTFDVNLSPVHGSNGHITGATIFSRDITERKQAETRLGEMHRTLVDVSRQAGMAEIATGVLHNVGNSLNSVNVSANLALDQVRQSRLMGLTRVVSLLSEHSSDLSSFLTQDPQGQQLPAYLSALSERLQREQNALIQELHSLSASVEHIKSIIRMQQKHARSAEALEEISVPQLIDEALRLYANAYGRLGIHIERDYAHVPHLLLDRHRLLQIVVNLLNNARDSLTASKTQDKRLKISIRYTPEEGRLRIQVTDNGLGIAPEHLPRMFSQGFTTKKEGHGFGLHISALSAMEMKGQLTCTSPGLGQGSCR